MIAISEIRRRARQLGLQESHVLRDYVLNHVLVAVARSFPEFAFRGGTALARAYWPDFRLSEDLDFIAEEDIHNLGERLNSAVDEAAKFVGRELILEFGGPRGGWSRSRLQSEFGELSVDVNIGERAYLPLEDRELNLPYSDFLPAARRVRCIELAEILGNKWFMLEDRKEPRDLYDLWAGLVKFRVRFDEIERGHRARYGFPPQDLSPRTAEQLSEQWDRRLAHQVANLPSVATVLTDIDRAFKQWMTS